MDTSKNKKIKITHNLGTWLPTSMNWIDGQIKCLPDDTFEHSVICRKLENQSLFPLRNLYSLQGTSSFLDLFFKCLEKCKIPFEEIYLDWMIKKVRPDILHSHVGTRGFYNLKIAKKYGLKHIVSFYGLDVALPFEQPEWGERYKTMFSQIDRVFCEGPFMANEIVKLGCPREKIIIQRLGVNLKNIPFVPRQYSSKNTIKFLIIARFTEKKGIPLALTALGEFQKEFDNFLITVIGYANNVEKELKEKEKILQTVEKYKLHEKVTFLGSVSHNEMLKQAYEHHIFISPSITSQTDRDTEGGAPVTIIEMAASGMPIISTKHCDIPNVLSPEYLEYLCPENDVECLVKTIKYVVNNDFSALVIHNREFIEENLSMDSMEFKKNLAQNYQELFTHNVLIK